MKLEVTIESYWAIEANKAAFATRQDPIYKSTMWTGTVEVESEHDDLVNKELWEKFNLYPPTSYNLPSLSVRDRVSYNGKRYEIKHQGFQLVA